VWGAHTVTLGGGGIEQLMTTPGPLEVCALGVVNWLIAKWRRATRVR
jgi:hypothetical protein